MTIRVVIADDHPPTRSGVRLALEADGGFEVCGETATAVGAVELVHRHRPDVALLDVRMPGSGINAARRIRQTARDTVIVMLTVSRDDTDLFAALQAGAQGYLLKDIDPDRLPHALRGVMSGEAALPRGLVARLMQEFRAGYRGRGRVDGPLDRLTEREWEVLRLMQAGRSTSEMAADLFVTQVTVRTHVSAILRKLHVRDRDEAIRLAGHQ